VTTAVDGTYQVGALPTGDYALRVDPSDPRLHGNLGVVYYKNEEYDNAITHLNLAVRGGMSDDGQPVEGLPLEYGRVEEYYWYYGFALARSNRCSEAVPLFQELLTGVPDDDIAVANAVEGMAVCQATIETPSPEPTLEATPTP